MLADEGDVSVRLYVRSVLHCNTRYYCVGRMPTPMQPHPNTIIPGIGTIGIGTLALALLALALAIALGLALGLAPLRFPP